MMHYYHCFTLLTIQHFCYSISSQKLDFYDFLRQTDIDYFQPFHINIVSDTSTECLDSVISNIRLSLPRLPIMVTVTNTNWNNKSLSLPVPKNDLYTHRYKNRKLQRLSPLFPKIKSHIVILSVSSSSNLFLQAVRNNLFWNSRARFFISLCKKKTNRRENLFSPKEVLRNFDKNDLYQAIVINGSEYLFYQPLSLKHQFVRGHFSTQLKWTDLFPEKFQNLNQKMLKAGTFHHPPAAVRKDKNHWEGVEILLLKVLADKLNFRFKVVPPAHNEKWGYQIPGTETWVGLFGQIIEGAVDVAFANMFLFEDRLLLAEFSSLYDDDKACFGVANRIGKTVDWIGPFKPFSLLVWIIIIFILVVVVLVFRMKKWITIEENLEIYQLRTQKDIHFENFDCIDSLGTCLGYTSAHLPKKISIRIIIVCWIISGLLITSLYKGFLISKMTVPVVELPIDTLHDLDKSGINVGGYIGFRNLLQFPVKLLPLYDKYINNSDLFTLLDRVAYAKDFALIENVRWFHYFIEEKYTDSLGNHLIHVVKECSGHFNVGFIFPIGSKYFPKMNSYIRRIFESGLISKWHEDALVNIKSSHRKNFTNYLANMNIEDTDKPTVLTLKHLQLSFYVLNFGCGLAILVGILELSYEKWVSNKLITNFIK